MNTKRMILGMQARNIAGDLMAEIELRQWSEEDRSVYYLYAVYSPVESIRFYGVSERSQWSLLSTCLSGGQDIHSLGWKESFESMDEAEISPYAAFYDMADGMLLNMKEVYEEAAADESEMEPIDLSEYNIPESKEELFRLRLSLETDSTMRTIFHDSDPASFEDEKKYVRALTMACESEPEYNLWKKNFIEAGLPAAKAKNIVICSYIFSGYGLYEMILPQEELHPFQGWLQASGAMDAGMREATEEEVRTYVAMHAARKG